MATKKAIKPAAKKRTTTSDLEGWSGAIRRAGEQGRKAELLRREAARKAIEATRKVPPVKGPDYAEVHAEVLRLGAQGVKDRLTALLGALDTGAIRVNELLQELRVVADMFPCCGGNDELPPDHCTDCPNEPKDNEA